MSAEEFRKALAALGLQQQDLARLLKVSPQTVNNWACGRHRIPGAVAALLKEWLEHGLPTRPPAEPTVS